MDIKKIGLPVLITGLVVVLIIGFTIGIFYQARKDVATAQQNQKVSQTAKVLTSDIVSVIALYGQVTAINGRDVTILYKGESLTVNIPANVSITLAQPKGTNSKVVDFSSIKIGNNLTIASKISENGKITAQAVIIVTSGSAQ